MHFAQLARRKHDNGFFEQRIYTQQIIKVCLPREIVAFFAFEYLFYARCLVAVLRVPALLIIIVGRRCAVGIVECNISYVFGRVAVGVGTEVKRLFTRFQKELAGNRLYECTFSASVHSYDGEMFPLSQFKIYRSIEAAVQVAGNAVL